MSIRLDRGTPKAPGIYIWAPEPSAERCHLINVWQQPGGFRYGVDWDEYLVVAQFGDRSVTHLKGTFSGPLEVRDGVLQEIDPYACIHPEKS